MGPASGERVGYFAHQGKVYGLSFAKGETRHAQDQFLASLDLEKPQPIDPPKPEVATTPEPEDQMVWPETPVEPDTGQHRWTSPRRSPAIAVPQRMPRLDRTSWRWFLLLVWRQSEEPGPFLWGPGEVPRDIETLDESEELEALAKRFRALFEAARYREAEEVGREMLRIAEAKFADQPATVAKAWNNLAVVLDVQAKYDEAEPHYRRCLELLETAFGADDRRLAECLNNLGAMYLAQGRYPEAEPLLKKALTLRQAAFGEDDVSVARSWQALASLYAAEARDTEAKHALERAIAALSGALGAEHPQVADQWIALGQLHETTGLADHASALYERSLDLWDRALADDPRGLAGRLHRLAALHRSRGDYEQAEALYRRVVELRKGPAGQTEHPDLANSLNELAMLLDVQGRGDEAEAFYRQALDILQAVFGNAHPRVAAVLHNLATLYVDQGRYEEAEPLILQAVAAADDRALPPGEQFRSRFVLARIEWGLGRRQRATTQLRRALRLAEQQRGRLAGLPYETAGRFVRFRTAFEQMVDWQLQLGNVAEAFQAAEQGRARTLEETLRLQGVDLLSGVPAEEARSLAEQRLRRYHRLASLEREFRFAEPADIEQLEAELHEARRDFVAIERTIRRVSPVSALLLRDDFQPVALQAVRQRLRPRNAVMLHYLLGNEGSYAFVVPAEGPIEFARLEVAPDQAEALGIEPGPLTAARLDTVLFGEAGKGLLASMNDPRRALRATPQLAALWQVLVPRRAQTLLAGGEAERLIVVPDGALGLVPFEALVLEGGAEPTYLLDKGPPIFYAPSASVLEGLARRQGSSEAVRERPVLSVGDPVYPQSPIRLAGNTQTQLAPLPHSGLESRWLGAVFEKRGTGVAQLLAGEATEGRFRQQVPGRRLVHVACHGLVDQRWGNLFGWLALTPGPDEPVDPADDGFLTLAETYELDLAGCELAILSACDTNVGPHQRGEGTWALSRGFLVAGARRVVASNWRVDDQATASLISYFCAGLAIDQDRGRPADYAARLHDAKRWVRRNDQHPQWRSPYYWAPFVLAGPD